MRVTRGELVPSTADTGLEAALRAKLALRRGPGAAASLGTLEPLALRLGLVQRNAMPRLESPRIVVFAADHGIAVEGIDDAGPPGTTASTVRALLAGQLPLSSLARVHGLELTVVDSGVAESLDAHPQLLARKIAYGTRNCLLVAAMSLEQALAAMRAGMEIGESLNGDVVACAGLGQGSRQSAALLLSCLSTAPLQQLADGGRSAAPDRVERQLQLLREARSRHAQLDDPVELLAATGGFEIAMMAGLMLVAASRRRLVVVDGLAARAALGVAAAIAPATADYCVHVRSHPHADPDPALEFFDAPLLVDLAIDAVDGTGAVLAWPLVHSAAALLAEPVAAPAPAARVRQAGTGARRPTSQP